MIELILRFFRGLNAQPQHDELLVRVRVEEKRTFGKLR